MTGFRVGCDEIRFGPQPPTPEQDAESMRQIQSLVDEFKRRKAMHYRNGREAKNGDKVIQLSTEGGKFVSSGILYDATPGNDYCNGNLAPTHGVSGACMCDCIHVDDLAAILKEKGLDKRPASK